MRKDAAKTKPKPICKPKPKPSSWWSGVAAMAQLGMPQK